MLRRTDDEATDDIASMTKELKWIEEISDEIEQQKSKLSELEATSDHWAAAEEAANEASSHLHELKKINEQVFELKRQLERCESELTEIANSLSKAKVVLGEVSMVGWLTRKWRDLPSPEEQEQIVKNRDLVQRVVNAHKRSLEYLRTSNDSDVVHLLLGNSMTAGFFAGKKVAANHGQGRAKPKALGGLAG